MKMNLSCLLETAEQRVGKLNHRKQRELDKKC